MNIIVEDVAPCKKRLKIEVPANRVQQAYDQVATDFQKEARIPGFRPGHAPRTVILKKFQKDIESETQRTLVPEAYREAISEKKLRVVSSPAIEDVKYLPGLSLSFSTIVELAPEFKLPDYKGLVLKKQDTAVTDEEVDKTLQSLADQRASFADAPERPLAMEDFAVISYTGKIDDKPLADIVPPQAKNLAHNPQFWLLMRAEGFLPKFAEQLVGLEKGKSRTVEVEFPTDFPQEALAGKKATYDVELIEIKIKVAPAIDDAFAQELAKMNLADLKARAKENLEQDKKAKAERESRSEIVEKLNSAIEFELPPSPVDEETHNAVYDIVAENQARGVPESMLEEKKDEIFSNAAKSARDHVKFKFIAAQIAESEKIEVTNEQFAQHIAYLAQRADITMEKMIDRVRKHNAFDGIRQQILRQNVLDFLLKEAKFE
jgi:trigger factor